MSCTLVNNSGNPQSLKNVVVAVHGGAGAAYRPMTHADEEYTHHLQQSLRAGYQVIRQGGSAVDAVEASARYLEDCPLFNAGRGAVLNSAGQIELDAAIMDGKTLAAGAVASVRTIKNPITAARAVMEKTSHVMLVAEGAEKFAAEAGLEIVDPSYFLTQHRLDQLKAFQAKLEHERQGLVAPEGKRKFGTIGAVARDSDGNLAVATSTGGTMNKLPGRVGDSPLIGAGTFADNASCAVSGTGEGEYFVRTVAAHSMSQLIKHKGLTVSAAADEVLFSVAQLGGSGGLIAIDAAGNCTLSFNSERMFRGCITTDGNIYTAIYGD